MRKASQHIDSDDGPEPLQVVYRPLSELIPDKRNARTHPKRQIEQLKSAITSFGFTNPVLIDEAALLIAGHGRLRAAKELGMADVPTITLAGLGDAEKRALRLADNKIALGAGWDMDLLKLELGELAELDVDLNLTLTGFSTGEIDVLLNDASEVDGDAIPAAPSHPKTRLGDIWQLGDHRVGCGDARDQEFLRAVIGDVKIDTAFLDPPYNVQVNGHVNAKGRHREFAMASGEMTASEFRAFLSETLGACAAVSRSGAVHFVCMDWRHMDDLSAAGQGVYGDLLNVCIWNKSNAGMGSLYRSKHEMVFVYRAGSEAHLNNVELGRHGRHRTNVWDYAPARMCAIHAIELFLNAFLRHEGISHGQIRGRMHNLADPSFVTTLKLRKKTAQHLRDMSEKREYLISRYAPEMASQHTEVNRLMATSEEIMQKVCKHLNTTDEIGHT